MGEIGGTLIEIVNSKLPSAILPRNFRHDPKFVPSCSALLPPKYLFS